MWRTCKDSASNYSQQFQYVISTSLCNNNKIQKKENENRKHGTVLKIKGNDTKILYIPGWHQEITGRRHLARNLLAWSTSSSLTSGQCKIIKGIVQWIPHYQYIHNWAKAGSLVLNELPNALWNNQSKWITMAHCITGIHTTNSPQVIWQGEGATFNHVHWSMMRSFANESKILIQ